MIKVKTERWNYEKSEETCRFDMRKVPDILEMTAGIAEQPTKKYSRNQSDFQNIFDGTSKDINPKDDPLQDQL